MKRSEKTPDYSQLKRKIMLQMLGMVAGAFFVVLAFYLFVWAGRGADFVVAAFRYLFGMAYDDALNLYWAIFRNNANEKFLIVLAVAFCAYLYFFITRFIRYFNEVNRGIDALVAEGETEIRLSSEMLPIEQKLNTVRQNLIDRAAAAQEAEQRKNDLVMYLAHDIRTPLTSVIGYLSLLDEAPDMPAEQKAKYVHITLDKALRLETLVDEFFEITRFNSQHIALQTERVDLHYLLIQLLDEFYPLLAARGNTAVLQADEPLMAVGDAAKLARVFNNLLKNAVSYSDAGTEILVCAQQNEGTLTVSFQNKGQTIPAEKLPAIFDKFCRLDASRASDTGGVGLGLSIAKEIVLAHGGSITAESEDGITTFCVCLPAPAEPATQNPSVKLAKS